MDVLAQLILAHGNFGASKFGTWTIKQIENLSHNSHELLIFRIFLDKIAINQEH